MKEKCRNCRKWEEEMYWSHFKSVQFIQILSKGYEQQLAIPKKFAKNLGEKIHKEVSLKVPSKAIWKIGIVSSGDNLFFRLGWKEFVQDNSLKEDDILVFRYNVNSQFDVLLFDRQNLCEKEASYFVRKCQDTEMSRGCKRKETIRKLASDHEPTSNYAPGQDGSSEVRSESSDDDVTKRIALKRTKDNGVAPKSVSRHSWGTEKKHGRKRNIQGSTLGIHHLQEYLSNRRPVTEEEKANAEQMADAASSSDSLKCVMQPYQVNRSFYLTLSAFWAREHLPPKDMDVILRLEEKSWNVRYQYRGGGGMLNQGWKQFALDNLLEEFDVCLFNLATDGRCNPIVLNVRIFRVVEEAIPQTPLRNSGRKGRPSRKYSRTE